MRLNIGSALCVHVILMALIDGSRWGWWYAGTLKCWSAKNSVQNIIPVYAIMTIKCVTLTSYAFWCKCRRCAVGPFPLFFPVRVTNVFFRDFLFLSAFLRGRCARCVVFYFGSSFFVKFLFLLFLAFFVFFFCFFFVRPINCVYAFRENAKGYTVPALAVLRKECYARIYARPSGNAISSNSSSRVLTDSGSSLVIFILFIY